MSRIAVSTSPPVCIEQAGMRAQRERFIRLPWTIYRDDPQWAPPLLMERRKFINPRKHPFYEFGTAALFLATRDGRDVGRLMVSDDPHFRQQQQCNAGFFGLFESTDDPAVAGALLDAARRWLRERGRTELWGPIDYSTNYACGLLIDGFDTPPRLTMNHNPPYYERLLRGEGLLKLKDLYAWWLEPNPPQFERWRTRVEKLAARTKLTLRPFDARRFREEARLCQGIYHEAWRENWAFVPMTAAEFQALAKEIVAYGQAGMLLIAEIGGQPVGFSMTMPDLNEALRPLNGRMFQWGLPLGYLKFHKALRHVRTARMLVLGVLPEFRRRGIAELLILRTFDIGMRQLGYSGAELSWTLEDNQLINRTIEAVGGKRYKTYRVYRQEIG